MSAYLEDQYVAFKEFNGFSPVHYVRFAEPNGRRLVHYVLFKDLNVIS
jgi:hypothetical protein